MKLLVVAALVVVAAADRPGSGGRSGTPSGTPVYRYGSSAGSQSQYSSPPSSGYGLKSRRTPFQSTLKPVKRGYKQGAGGSSQNNGQYRSQSNGGSSKSNGQYSSQSIGSSNQNNGQYNSQSNGGFSQNNGQYRSQSNGSSSKSNGRYSSQSIGGSNQNNGQYSSQSNGGYSQNNGQYNSQSNGGYSQNNGRYSAQSNSGFSQQPSRAYSKPEPTPAPQPYSFSYDVLDVLGNDYGAAEESNGEEVQGQYSVLLPDGRLQTVSYSVQGDSGFVADVQYEGEARFFDADGVEQGRSSVASGAGPAAGYGYAANY